MGLFPAFFLVPNTIPQPPTSQPRQFIVSSHLHTRICHPTSIRPSLLCSQQPTSYVMETARRLVMYFQWKQREEQDMWFRSGRLQILGPSSSLRLTPEKDKGSSSTLVMHFFHSLIFFSWVPPRASLTVGRLQYPIPISWTMLLPLLSWGSRRA